jgi:hypothetical protein
LFAISTDNISFMRISLLSISGRLAYGGPYTQFAQEG